MVQSPSWAANWFAASQEIDRISRNPKVHYRTHNRPPPVYTLGQPNPVDIPTSHLLEIQSNIIHPSTPRSPQWFISLRFPHQDPSHTGFNSDVSLLGHDGVTVRTDRPSRRHVPEEFTVLWFLWLFKLDDVLGSAYLISRMFGIYVRWYRQHGSAVTILILQRRHNLLAPELLFLILAHPVYKMWIIQEPNMLELWNKLNFEEEKNGEYIPCLKYSVPIFVELIYKMQLWRLAVRYVNYSWH